MLVNFFVFLSLLVMFGCHEKNKKFEFKNIQKISGEIHEQGNLKDEVNVLKFNFIKPDHFHAQMVKPKRYEGISIKLEKNELSYHYPMANFSIVLKNFFKFSTQNNQKNLNSRIEEKKRIYKISNKKHKNGFGVSLAANSNSFVKKGEVSFETRYMFPKMQKLYFINGKKHHYEIKNLSFTQLQKFSKKNTKNHLNIKAEWDFAGEEASLKLFSSMVGKMPPEKIADFRKVKTVKMKGMIPAFASLYQNKASFLIFAQFKDLFNIGKKLEYGVKVLNKPETRLIYNPLISSLAYSQNSFMYIVISNSNIENLLDISQILQK